VTGGQAGIWNLDGESCGSWDTQDTGRVLEVAATGN